MVIQRALVSEYEQVKTFYYDVIDRIDEMEYGPAWQKGIYPCDDYLLSSIEKGELYVGRKGDEIISAMILNHSANESYATGRWITDSKEGQYMVIHALCVMPSYGRKGYAKELVLYALHLARISGMNAIRLDVLAGNVAAEKLYQSLGFVATDRLPMYYEDTGWTDFILYEYDLNAFKVVRAEEEWQRAGAYSVRIEGMNRQHHMPLREEFDDRDSDGTRYILLLDQEYPVATCRFYELDMDTVTLGRVVVLPEYRGRHLGDRLLREAEAWIRELGYKQIHIDSRINAVPFYLANEYKKMDDKVVVSGVFDCIEMMKHLL